MSAAASPWKIKEESPKNQFPSPISLSEIMDEELATKIQAEEEIEATKLMFPETSDRSNSGVVENEMFIVPEADCSNDILLAQYLQHEFDREHDTQLRREQEKYNGTNKVTVSFEKYKTVHPMEDSDSSESEDEDLREILNKKIDSKRVPTFGPSGYMRQSDGTIVTKHDKVISGRKNTQKALDAFGPTFHTGDAAGIDLQLSNHVFNKLKVHSIHEEKRSQRLHDKKEKATTEMSMDVNTRLIVFKLVNNGMLETVSGVVSTGKEAAVFHSCGGSSEDKEIPEECALKVYKTTLNEFKNRCEYVKDDYRFKNPRKIMKVWAEKEMLNLNRMQRAGIRCPTVVKLKKHVLVMSFLGKDGVPAPKLQETKLNEEELHLAYDECVEAMRMMYYDCSLVHADLSEFNILYWEGHCWIIDVSQAVDLSHPKSLVFLARDCHHLTLFFQKRGLEDIPTPRELFNGITELDIKSEENFFSEVQDYQVENRSLQQRKDKSHPADCTLRKFQAEEKAEQEAQQESEDIILSN